MNKLIHRTLVLVLTLFAPAWAIAHAQSMDRYEGAIGRPDFDPLSELLPGFDGSLHPPLEPPWVKRGETLLSVFPDNWSAGFDATRSYFVDIPGSPAGDSMQLSDQTFAPCWNAPLVSSGSTLIFSSGYDGGTYHGSFRARDMSAELRSVFRSATRSSDTDLVLSFLVGGAYGSYRPGNYFYRPITVSLDTGHYEQLAALRFSRASGQPRRVQVVRPDGGFDDATVPAAAGGASLDELWVVITISASNRTVTYQLFYTNQSGSIDRQDELEYPLSLPDSTWDQGFSVSVMSETTGAACGTASYNQLVLKDMTLRAQHFRYLGR